MAVTSNPKPTVTKAAAIDAVKDTFYAAFILLRIILIPVEFLWAPFTKFVLACFDLYIMRLGSAIFRLIDGRLCRCIDLRYIDKEFPATASSVNSKHPEGKFYAWMRAFDLSVAKGNDATYLFADGITAGDLCQGGLGDCWLIAAIAALAEYPGLIQRIFITKETSPFGRYTLRLFDITEDGGKGKFVNVTVDDRLPCKCDGGFPRLMYLSMDEAGEIWPLLIEKALAKWSGSYENLDGGHCAWALATLTGWETDTYIKFNGDSNFTKCALQPDKQDPRNPHEISFRTSSVTVAAEDFFDILVESDSKDYIMTCGTHSGNDTVEDSSNGIVQGHAYTLIGAHEIGKHRLVQLRNPWGSFEWKGPWSDKHENWDKYPKVKEKLNPTSADDGIFYMSYEEFMKNYRKVDICKRAVNAYTDLYLDVNETDGCPGPTKSCFTGCGKFIARDGYRLGCGREVHEGDDFRKKWWARSVSFLVKDFKAIRAKRVAEKGGSKSMV